MCTVEVAIQYYNKGYSLQKSIHYAGATFSHVYFRKELMRRGIPVRKQSICPDRIAYEKRVIKDYEDNVLTVTEIARKHSIRRETVFLILKRHGLKPSRKKKGKD